MKYGVALGRTGKDGSRIQCRMGSDKVGRGRMAVDFSVGWGRMW